MPAQERAREQKVTHVCARDEQHKKYHHQGDSERRGHIASLVEGRFPQWQKREVPAAISFRVILLQPLRNGMKLSVGLLARYARFQEGKTFDPARVPVLQLVASRV